MAEWRILILSWICLMASQAHSQTISTSLGTIIGTTATSRAHQQYYSFRKIRYATAQRFKSPVLEHRFESDPYYAEGNSPFCPQLIMSNNIGSEDCLFMDIFTPANRSSSLLPVLFYVHGGAFTNGMLQSGPYADFIMDYQVVLVAIQYRLGVFGFLSTGDSLIPGNFGLKDQKAALEWVTDYIHYFGGDPKRITVFGVSAGAASTHYLITLPKTRDMVVGAVSASGTITHSWSVEWPETAAEKANALAVGCADKSYFCLFTLSTENLLRRATSMYLPTIEVESDDAIISSDPTLMTSTKPWMTSTTNGEFLMFEMILRQSEIPERFSGPSAEIIRSCLNIAGKMLAPDAADLIIKRYFPTQNTTIEQYATFIQDFTFIYTMFVALEKHQGPKYCYHLEYKGEMSLPDTPSGPSPYPQASHGDDSYSWFHVRENYPWVPVQPALNDTKVSKAMVNYLIAFAETGSPKTAIPEWSEYSADTPNIYRFKADGTFSFDSAVYQDKKELTDFWKRVFSGNTNGASSLIALSSMTLLAFLLNLIVH